MVIFAQISEMRNTSKPGSEVRRSDCVYYVKTRLLPDFSPSSWVRLDSSVYLSLVCPTIRLYGISQEAS